MSNKQIKKFLDLNGIDNYTSEGHIFMITFFTTKNGNYYEHNRDITGIGRLDLLELIGQ